MSDEAFHSYLMEVSSAADAFVVRECEILARRAVWHAMRIKASGWFGGDYKHKTLWDEYCQFVQDDSGSGWAGLAESEMEKITAMLTEKLPRETLLLISLSKAFDTEDFENPPVGLRHDLITAAVLSAVNATAINRDLDHLGPNQDWEY